MSSRCSKREFHNPNQENPPVRLRKDCHATRIRVRHYFFQDDNPTKPIRRRRKQAKPKFLQSRLRFASRAARTDVTDTNCLPSRLLFNWNVELPQSLVPIANNTARPVPRPIFPFVITGHEFSHAVSGPCSFPTADESGGGRVAQARCSLSGHS